MSRLGRQVLEVAVMVAVSALLYVEFFRLNTLIFSRLEHIEGVNWIFLPAGFRVLLVLGYSDIYVAGDAVPEITPFGPIAIASQSRLRAPASVSESPSGPRCPRRRAAIDGADPPGTRSASAASRPSVVSPITMIGRSLPTVSSSSKATQHHTTSPGSGDWSSRGAYAIR